MGFASDLIIREFSIAPAPEIRIKAAVILIKGLSSREIVDEQVMFSLMSDNRFNNIKTIWSFSRQLRSMVYPVPM